MSSNNNIRVPFYAKFWWVITWIVMIVILVMVGRNFVGSIVFGTSTGQKEIADYYNNGFSDAMSGRKAVEPSLNTDNPVLIKSYSKGFREGLDKKWKNKN